MLDPFGGSGTTPAVAKKLNRRFLAFELSKDYADQARKRLAAIEVGDPLDGAADPLSSVPDTANGRRLDEKTKKEKSARPHRQNRKTAPDQKHLPGL